MFHRKFQLFCLRDFFYLEITADRIIQTLLSFCMLLIHQVKIARLSTQEEVWNERDVSLLCLLEL